MNRDLTRTAFVWAKVYASFTLFGFFIYIFLVFMGITTQESITSYNSAITALKFVLIFFVLISIFQYRALRRKFTSSTSPELILTIGLSWIEGPLLVGVVMLAFYLLTAGPSILGHLITGKP